MPDQEAKPPARTEQNGTTGPQSPRSGDRPSWGSEDRLENLANILTALVALSAIGLAVWQGYENRRFFRLSVLPHLEPIEASIGTAEPLTLKSFPFLQNSDSLYAVSYALENSGFGPAVVQNFLVFHNGEKIFDAVQADSTYHKGGVRHDLDHLPFETGFLNTSYPPGDMLKAGEVHGFIEVPIAFSSLTNVDSLDRDVRETVMDEVLKTRSFVFCYCSVYGTDCGMTYLGAEPPVEDVCGF